MDLTSILAFGFLLGMRHATDADHVVAVSTIVSRERSLRAALPIGTWWGLGHMLTVVLVGGALIAFGVVIPPRLANLLEGAVGVMLLALGALNVYGVLRPGLLRTPERTRALRFTPSLIRPLCVGIVHGLAGSTALALLVLGAIGPRLSALLYLLLFGVGTLVGMLLVTTLLALPIAAAAVRFSRLHRALTLVTAATSMGFGVWLLLNAPA